MIGSHDCPNSYMDSRYGRGMRVWNETKGGKEGSHRCANCGRGGSPRSTQVMEVIELPKSASGRKRLSAKQARNRSKPGKGKEKGK